MSFAIVFVLLTSVFFSIPPSSADSPTGTTPTGVTGATLSPSITGDTSDWIEIARQNEYSLIVRKNYINIYSGSGHYGDPIWQYCPYSTTLNNNYNDNSCNVRDAINNWFNGHAYGSAVDNLPANARLRDYTVHNTATSTLGTSNEIESQTNGFSQPTTNQAKTGHDLAFALSYSEVAKFLSKTHDVQGMNPQIQPSNPIAIANFDKISTLRLISMVCGSVLQVTSVIQQVL